MVFERKQPKCIVFLPHIEYDENQILESDSKGKNETDRIPRELIVERYHLACFAISIFSYLFDISSDVYIGISHYKKGLVVPSYFVLGFAILPSVILNLTTISWYHQDRLERKFHEDGGNKKLEIRRSSMNVLCLLQLGPVWWHMKALYYGIQFRRQSDYCSKRLFFGLMIEAERDATLLRLFEGFLEAAPQLVIQSTLLINYLSSDRFEYPFLWQKLPFWAYCQMISIAFSLFSMCWAITSQHRTIRIIQANKVNIHPIETVVQLIWRISTIYCRLITFALCLLRFGFYTLYFVVAHFIVSLFHVVALQSIDISFGNTSIEIGMFFVNGLIHIFTPFNMAEGKTRYRYLTAYSIEFLETLTLFLFLFWDRTFHLPLKTFYCISAAIGFIVGISTMILYYLFLHPNRRKHKRIRTEFRVANN